MKNYSHQTNLIAENPLKKGIFWGTGSGKTRTALQLAEGKVLVICPKTQREDKTWERELQKLNVPLDLTVLSKEDFKKKLHTLPYFDTIIGDEAHTLCGVTPFTRQRNKVKIPKVSQIFEALDWYVRNFTPKRLYLVTATPIPQPMAVWGASKLLGHKMDFVQFRKQFYIEINMRGRQLWLPRKDDNSKNVLASIVQKIGVTGRLTDWFDVPEQTHKNIMVGMTKEQSKKIDELELLYPDPIVLIGKKHQLEQGIFEGQFLPQNKFEQIEELADEFGKILVFCKYTRQIEELEKYLKAQKRKVLTLTGKTQKRRDLMVSAEQEGPCVVIAQAQVSAGYELPSYRCTIFCSKSYSFVDHDQSLGRTLRANNLQKNLYITLHSGDIDVAVSDSVENKKDFSERIYAEKRGYLYNESTEVDSVDEDVSNMW